MAFGVASGGGNANVPNVPIVVVGPPGPQGTPGVAATVVPVATPVTAATAVQPDPATPGSVQAVANPSTSRFAGLSTQSTSAGHTQAVQYIGPVAPATLSLGAGVACAVGCKADGAPCRVTDPACVSGLNFLGWCDTAGTIQIAPRVAQAYSIVDFGAVPNDSSSGARAANTTAFKAIQAALGSEPAYPYRPRGGLIVASHDDYYFAADAENVGGTGAGVACIHLTNPVTVQGSGSRYSPGTRFFFPSGVIGIQTHHAGASGAKIDGCYLKGEGARTVTTAHGIDFLTATQVSNCVVEGFGGHGINWNGSGFPDYCKVSYTYCVGNLDGVHITASGDTSGGGLYMVDCQANRGWGFYDHSFLGTKLDNCTASENMRGPADFSSTGGGSVDHLYTEADQPPGRSAGPCRVILGGTQAAGWTPASQFFGGANGYAQMHAAGFIGKTNVADLTATGTAPEQVTLGGVLASSSISIRIEVTQAGYPGGFDSFGNAQTPLHIRYSTDGGSTWTAVNSITRGDNGYVYGLAAVALGASGLTAYFVPYFYPLDSVYTSTGAGGETTRAWVGSSDGSLSVFGWEHLLPSTTNDPGPWRLKYSGGLWDFTWSYTSAVSWLAFAGGRSLPGPGEALHASALWLGHVADGPARIGRADLDAGAVGSTAWRSSTRALNQCYRVGDVVLNMATTSRFPAAWRAKQPGGWAHQYPATMDAAWSAGAAFPTGGSVTPTTPNGYVYQCTTHTGTSALGVTGSAEPTWPTSPGATVVDHEITWTCFGVAGNPFESLTAVESYTPTSSADTHGVEGDTAQDANFYYWKSASGWRRAAGGAW